MEITGENLLLKQYEESQIKYKLLEKKFAEQAKDNAQKLRDKRYEAQELLLKVYCYQIKFKGPVSQNAVAHLSNEFGNKVKVFEEIFPSFFGSLYYLRVKHSGIKYVLETLIDKGLKFKFTCNSTELEIPMEILKDLLKLSNDEDLDSFLNMLKLIHPSEDFDLFTLLLKSKIENEK